MAAAPSVRDAQGRPVVLGQALLHDDETALFLVERRQGTVARVWLDPMDARQAARLGAMVRVRTSALDEYSAWPFALLYHPDGPVCGMLMTQVGREFCTLRKLFAAAGDTDWGTRLPTALHLAQAFEALHGAGQVMGNVSDWQVMAAPDGRVRLIGTEGYQVREGDEVYPSALGLPEYTPPELQRGGTQVRTAQHDLFGLAVMLFRLLFGGRHPYSGVPVGRPMPGPGEAIALGLFAYAEPPPAGVRRPPDAPALEVLPPAVQALFTQAFGPGPRPGAHDWIAALGEMQRALRPCPDHPAGHLGVEGRPCPVCVPPGTAAATAQHRAEERRQATERLWQRVQGVRPPDRPPVVPPDVPDGSHLPPLALNLPPAPRTLLRPAAQARLWRWLLRLLVLAALTLVVTEVQHSSVLAAVVEVVVVVLVLTLGRRFSVDWDGLIDRFQAAEGRFVARLTPAQGRWQTYHAAATARRDDLRQRFVALRQQYRDLEERYAEDHAHARYQRELLDLDSRRRRLQQGTSEGQGALRRLTEEQAAEALAEYLRRQMITPNVVPGLSARTALHLTTMGLRRASDVQGDKLRVVRPHLAAALTDWRGSLSQFFQFNPDQIPPAERATAQRREQEQAATEWRRFEQDMRRFVATDWAAHEQELLEQLREVKAQARQHQKALKQLEALTGAGTG